MKQISIRKGELGIETLLRTRKACYGVNVPAKLKITRDVEEKNSVVVKSTSGELQIATLIPKKYSCKKVLDKFGLDLLIPVHGVSRIKGEVLAEIKVDWELLPAIVKKDGKTIFAFDLNRTILDLLRESYFQRPEDNSLLSNPFVNFAFKKTPFKVKMLAAKKYYSKKTVPIFPQFPVEPSMWALGEILLESLGLLSPVAVLNPWPKKWAFCLTHDAEPAKFAYTKGMNLLLDSLEQAKVKTTINMVSSKAKKLTPETIKRLKGFEIGSHSELHDAKIDLISIENRKERISNSKNTLEKKFGKIHGFRSPWLLRPDDLYDSIKIFDYDSSYIDIDRSTPRWYGGGVCTNLPYFLPKGAESSDIVELPISGPMDNTLMYSFPENQYGKIIKSKADWIRETESLFLPISHVPCWKGDVKLRMTLLNHFLKQRDKDCWFAKANEIAKWWKKRDAIKMDQKGNNIELSNTPKGISATIYSKGQKRKASLSENLLSL